MGAFYCECPATFYGHNCTTTDQPTRICEPLGIFYRHVFQASTAVALLIAVRSLGDTAFTLEVETDTYFILSRVFQIADFHRWTYTSDLRTVALQIGIQSAERIPAMTAFYFVVENVRIVRAEQSFFVCSLKLGDDGHLLYKWKFEYLAVESSVSGCVPQIEYPQW